MILPSSPVYTKSDLWFADGNIVLAAEDTAFRVFSGFLTQSSGVLRSMFTFPKPLPAEMEMLDGVPLVHMHDSAVDLAHFLRAIYDRCVAYMRRIRAFAELVVLIIQVWADPTISIK